MKVNRFNFFSILVILSCYGCGPDSRRDDFDLSHHYEPHVTKRHSGTDLKTHYYSVMLIVKKDCKVYTKRDTTENSIVMEYSFSQSNGFEENALKKYNLNNEYELRLYEYEVKKEMENFAFYAKVDDVPIDHPHEDPQFLHNGTIHTPGGS